MPTRLPERRDPPPGRFRAFMAATPPWFQWATLAAMFLAALGAVVLFFYVVKTGVPADAAVSGGFSPPSAAAAS